jgi:hypothetical protein
VYLGLTVASRLNVPGEKVWSVLKDFGGHYQFNPLIRLSPISNGIEEGLGAEREVYLYDGSVIRQIILDYREGESLLIGTTQSARFIKQATTRYSIEPPDQPFCRVRIDVTYEPKFGLAGGAMGVVYKPTLRSQYGLVLRGLEHFAKTGQVFDERVP